MSPSSGPSGGPVALLACQAGGETYCLPMARVLGLERGEGMLPAAEGDTGGMLAGRLRTGGAGDNGSGVPVYRLAALVGSPLPARDRFGPVVLLDGRRGPFGLMVERVERTEEVGAANLLALPRLVTRAAGSPLEAVARLSGRLALVLAAERLVPGGDASPAEPWEVPESSAPGTVPDGTPSRGSGAPQSAAAGPRRLLLFSTSPGGEAPVLFGLSLSQVQEIVRPQPLLRVPGAPPYLLGLAPFRDEVVPVIDLSLRMGAGPSFFEGESRLLVARGARVPLKLGFPVRPEVRVESLPLPNQVNATGRLLDRSLVRGVFQLEAGTVFIPDLDRFLSRGVRRSVASEARSPAPCEIRAAG